jgi:hypothetical protein
MAQVNKIDSNCTELRIAEEASLGVLPGTPDWIPYEPNSYPDFGGEITTVARNPINPSRQRKKGVVTDLDAAGGFETDLTQANIQNLLQGFFWADFLRKGEEVPTQATATTDLFAVASTTGFQVNDLIWVTGFVNAANNGLHVITAIVVDTTIEVLGSTLVTETPPATANIVVVGHQGGAGDIDVDDTGNFATYTSTTLDFTTLGLNPGEWIYVGGDLAAEAFTTAANNGWKRVKSIAANALVVDKSELAMATEASTTETIRMFFGRVLKNQNTKTTIVRRSYQLERQLGAPDDASPANIQAEYLVGQVPGEMTINIGTADKITAELNFQGTDQETIDGPTALKSGNRPAVVEADAFNTSSDFSRLKMAVVSTTSEAPTPLFAFITEMTINLNNNLNPNKAVSVLGAFDITGGTFEVGGSITAYFSNVSAISAIRNNSDVTMDLVLAKANAGIALDIPLITLGDGKLNVEQDEPITIPVTNEAASGAKVDPNMDHTLMMVFFDYLPTAAES